MPPIDNAYLPADVRNGRRSAVSSTTPRSPSSASSSASSPSSCRRRPSRPTARAAPPPPRPTATCSRARSPTPSWPSGGLGLAQQLDNAMRPGGHQVSAALLRLRAGGDRARRARCSPTSTTQLASTRRLLQLVLAQGTAIRAQRRRRPSVRHRRVQAEMEPARAPRARPRAILLPTPARRSASTPHAVTLDAICALDARRPTRPPPASAAPSCAACSPRSPASTHATAR